MPSLKLVEDQTFDHQTVLVTGHHFLRCKFHSCDFLFRGMPFGFDSCEFYGASTWDLQFVAYDETQWDEFLTAVAPMVTKQLPRLPK
jgi:hypothetical protein